MMKYIFSLTLLCFGLLAQAQIPSYVPTNGLVGWWPFNGNANDESGNGNNGTVNGATLAADRFGNAGKAYSFDGVNDKIDIIANSNFNFEDFSVSCWINSNNKPYTEAVICKSDWNNASSETFALTLNSGSYLTHIKNYSNCIPGAGWVSRQTSSQNNNNVWTNIVITFGNSALNVYKNGNLILMGTLSKKLDVCNGGQVKFGAAWVQYPDFFNGLLDDIAIYNRALSASEVQQLYCQTQPTFTTQPKNKSVAQGQTTTFAVQVDSATSFQWQMNLGLGAGWANIPASALFSGDTTASLSVQGRSTIDGAQFRCIATSCNADTSNAATLTVTSSTTAAAGNVAGVPGLINYQGSALDSLGKPMKNQTISLKLSVLDSSSTGAAVYVESHSAATNGSGHFAIQIGGGTANLGTLDSVGWSNGRNKYLKTELSQNGTWVNLGTSQLVSVPYALHAGSAENAKQSSLIIDSIGNSFYIGYLDGKPSLVSQSSKIISNSLTSQTLLKDTFQIIPKGISMVHIDIRGGNGGNGNGVPFCPYIQGALGGCSGGLGSSAELIIFVQPNDTLSFSVGQNGSIGQPGGNSTISRNGVLIFSAGGGTQGSDACCGGAAWPCGYTGNACGRPIVNGSNGACSPINFQSKIALLKTGNIGGGIIFVNYY